MGHPKVHNYRCSLLAPKSGTGNLSLTPWPVIIKYLIITIVSLRLALILRLVILILSSGRYNKTLEKSSPFECGFLGLEERRSPFRVHFFIVSLIFLIFDIELVILFPYLGSL